MGLNHSKIPEGDFASSFWGVTGRSPVEGGSGKAEGFVAARAVRAKALTPLSAYREFYLRYAVLTLLIYALSGAVVWRGGDFPPFYFYH